MGKQAKALSSNELRKAGADTIAEALRKQARKQGKTAYRLSRDVKLPVSMVSRWLDHGGGLTTLSASLLADHLGLSLRPKGKGQPDQGDGR